MVDFSQYIQGYKDYFSKKPLVLKRLAKGVINRLIFKRPHLRVAELATTFICNSKCEMCSCSKFLSPDKEKNRLTVSDYELLGKQLDALDCVSINVTGGEPLLRDDINEVIKALNPKSKMMNLITNGIRLSKEKVRYFSSLGIDSIVVSLESTNEEENDKIRGYKGHFQHVMKAIEWAKEEKVKVGISLTLGDFNFEKVFEMIQFAKDKLIFLCIAHGGSIGNWEDNDSILLSKENAEKLLELIKTKYKKLKIDFSSNLSLQPGCPAIKEKIFIDPYGEVMSCAFNPVSFGNIREEPLTTIWKKGLKFMEENTKGETLCLRTYNKDYIDKFLVPIKNQHEPVRIDKHPYFLNLIH